MKHETIWNQQLAENSKYAQGASLEDKKGIKITNAIQKIQMSLRANQTKYEQIKVENFTVDQ